MTPPEGQLHVGAALGQIIAAWRDGRHKDCAEALVGIYHCIVDIENERNTLTERNRELREALVFIAAMQPSDIDSAFMQCVLRARRLIEET